jgi:spermidine synthase
MKKNTLSFFYSISFLEGGMMLVTELASTRKISVFFGSSLYVWLIVLCITMIGLALGYYWANHLLNKKHSDEYFQKTLSYMFFVLSVSLIIWKFNSDLSLFLIDANIGLIPCVLVDASALLVVPMFLYGAITTLVIHLAQKHTHQAVYGKILAYSTLGSVLFSVTAVMVCFPVWGIQNTMYVLSSIAIMISLWLYAEWKYFPFVILLLIYPERKIKANVLYQNDGAFSSVMVIHQNNVRYLMVNYIIQSYVDDVHGQKLPYVHLIDSVFQSQGIKNKDILILGLGGGVLANQLAQYNRSITGVEIDPRIIECAKKYFNLNPKVKAICEDAQWFIRKNKKPYDIIVLDLFNGEEPPAYMLTQENFFLLKKMLKNDSGLIIVNWHGYYSGKTGKGTRILVNTMEQSGLHVCSLSTGRDEKSSNTVLFAAVDSSILPKNIINMEKEIGVNTSDKNILFYFNAEANYHWRKDYLYFIRQWWK